MLFQSPARYITQILGAPDGGPPPASGACTVSVLVDTSVWVIELLQALAMVPVATPPEMIELLARRQLYGRGCGFVNMSLLAGALLCGATQLWTLDKRLAVLAHEVGVAYELGLH